MIFSAIPFYLIGLVLVYVFGYQLGWFPLGGGMGIRTAFVWSVPLALEILYHSILPAISILLATLGTWALSMRGMMVTVQGEDYMTFAEALGLTDRRRFLQYGLRNAILPQVTLLAGQSGVGKTTLLNCLVPEAARKTRSLSDSTEEGRHTTVAAALFHLPSGGELIDSPGVRDYAPAPVEDANIQVGWPEILQRAAACRFNNCMHLREPGCAVLAAVNSGDIAARRYESYKRLLNVMRGLAPDYERRR